MLKAVILCGMFMTEAGGVRNEAYSVSVKSHKLLLEFHAHGYFLFGVICL